MSGANRSDQSKLLSKLGSPYYSAVKLVVNAGNAEMGEFLIPVSMFKLFETMAHRLESPEDAAGGLPPKDESDSSQTNPDGTMETLKMSVALTAPKSVGNQRNGGSSLRLLTVVLDEENTTTIADLLLWLYRDPDFTITLDNLGNLTRISSLYRIKALSRDVDAFMSQASTSFELYTIAINNNIQWLESRDRSWVFAKFSEYLELGHFQKLSPANSSKLIKMYVADIEEKTKRQDPAPTAEVRARNLEIQGLRTAMQYLKVWIQKISPHIAEQGRGPQIGHAISVWEQAMQETW